MIGFLITIAAATLLLIPVTLVQILYLETLRLRARDYAAFEYFREHIAERLGLKPERGVLTFSILKHSLLVFLGVACLGFATATGNPLYQALIEAVLLSWALMLITIYIVPQLLYRKTSGRWLLALYPFVRVLSFVALPIVALLELLQSLAALSEPETAPDEKNGHPAEHIEALITASAEEGIIEEEERKLIQSVVEFGAKTVREVMTPRPNIVAIEASETLEQLRSLVIHEQYSRIPVYRETIDDIIGFVHVRDMFEMDDAERAQRTVLNLVREISRVPETKPVNDLLREMQVTGAHMAVVIDEYGNTAGLVTMEDLVEELVGEIRDEHEPGHDIIPDGHGAYIVSGSFDLDGLRELLQYRPGEETESTTVGGLVSEWMGRVPAPGESVEREGIRIDVLQGNELRVEQVRVSKAASNGNG